MNLSLAKHELQTKLDEHDQIKSKAKVEMSLSVFRQVVSFFSGVQDQREKVRLFLGVAQGIVSQEPVPAHSADINQWMNTVRERYTDFSKRMEKLGRTFEEALGKPKVPLAVIS